MRDATWSRRQLYDKTTSCASYTWAGGRVTRILQCCLRVHVENAARAKKPEDRLCGEPVCDMMERATRNKMPMLIEE